MVLDIFFLSFSCTTLEQFRICVRHWKMTLRLWLRESGAQRQKQEIQSFREEGVASDRQGRLPVAKLVLVNAAAGQHGARKRDP